VIGKEDQRAKKEAGLLQKSQHWNAILPLGLEPHRAWSWQGGGAKWGAKRRGEGTQRDWTTGTFKKVNNVQTKWGKGCCETRERGKSLLRRDKGNGQCGERGKNQKEKNSKPSQKKNQSRRGVQERGNRKRRRVGFSHTKKRGKDPNTISKNRTWRHPNEPVVREKKTQPIELNDAASKKREKRTEKTIPEKGKKQNDLWNHEEKKTVCLLDKKTGSDSAEKNGERGWGGGRSVNRALKM